MRIILVFMICAMAGSYMRKDGQADWESGIIEKIREMQSGREEWEQKFEKQETMAVSKEMSTKTEKIKRSVNNVASKYDLSVKSLEIRICDDYLNVDYGKIFSISIKLEKIVDKTVNMFIEPVIIKQQQNCVQNLREKSEFVKKFRQDIAYLLQIEEEVLEIEID